MNKFEQVSSDGYQMSLARVLGPVGVSCLMSRREEGPGLGGRYSEVQCIKSNGHMGTPCEQTDMSENTTFPQLR